MDVRILRSAMVFSLSVLCLTQSAMAQFNCVPAASACNTNPKKDLKIEKKLNKAVGKFEKQKTNYQKKKDKIQTTCDIKNGNFVAKEGELALAIIEAGIACAASGNPTSTVGSINAAGFIVGSRVAAMTIPTVLASITPECAYAEQLENQATHLAAKHLAYNNKCNAKLDVQQGRIDKAVHDQGFVCCQWEQFITPVTEGGLGCPNQLPQSPLCDQI